jgi:hypothetical protein
MQYTFPADVGSFADTGVFIKADGTRALTGDWDIGAGRILKAETIQARANNLILLGDKLGIKNPSPVATIDILDSALNVNMGGVSSSLAITATATGSCTTDRGVAALNFSINNNAVPQGFALHMYGIYGSARNIRGYLLSSLAGIVGTAFGLHTSGTVDSATGVYGVVTQFGAGTISNVYGVNGHIETGENGILTNAYGIYSHLATVSGGSIGTGYGLYINAVAGATAWGVYVNAAVNNYFAGNLGIGITPTARLHLSSLNDQDALKIVTERGGEITFDEWGQLNFVHSGVGIGYDSNISQVAFHSLTDLYLSAGKGSGSPYNILLLPSATGKIGLLTKAPASPVDINADVIRLRSSKTPNSAGDTGNQGDICWDSNHVYICVAADTWKRTALTSW